MKLTLRQIIETYKYENERERDAHSDEMIRAGWGVIDNSIMKSGLIKRYVKNEKPE